MSNMFRDVGGQGASSSTSNTQAWLKQEDDWANSDAGKSILAKIKRGEKLDAGDPSKFNADNFTSVSGSELNQYNLYKHWQDKAKATGVEDPYAVSKTSTPDATDKQVQATKMAQTLQLMSGRGRKQSFLGGVAADNSVLGTGSMLGGL